MNRDPRFAARLGSLTQLVFALLLGSLASMRDPVPEFLPRGLVLALAFGLPGVVGLLGVRARRPEVVLAAGVVSAAGSVIAFSGVSLIFLIPAFLLLGGAARVRDDAADPPPAEPRDAGARRLPARLAALVGRSLLAITVAGLLIGAGGTVLFITDERCWTAFETPAGTVFATTPFDAGGEQQIPAEGSSAGCATGLISARGVGLATLLGTAAIGLVLVTDRRRGGHMREWPVFTG